MEDTTETKTDFTPVDHFCYRGAFCFNTPRVNTNAFKGIGICPDLNTVATEIYVTREEKKEQIKQKKLKPEIEKLELAQNELQFDKNVIAFNTMCNLSKVQWSDEFRAPVIDQVPWEQRTSFNRLYTPIYPNPANMISIEQHNAKLLEAAKNKKGKKKAVDHGNKKFVWFEEDEDGTVYEGVKTSIREQVTRNPWMTDRDNPPVAVVVWMRDHFCWVIKNPNGGLLYQEM